MTDLTEFHFFPYLPEELRVIIWNLTLRPLDRRGVHIFNVEERTSDKWSPVVSGADVQETRALQLWKRREPGMPWLHTCVVLGNPKTTREPQGAPRSTYLIDGGLWIAYDVISKAFDKTNESCTTSLFVRKWSRPMRCHYFTVFQDRDLFTYRPECWTPMKHRDRALEGEWVPGSGPVRKWKPVSRWERIFGGEPDGPQEDLDYEYTYRHLDKLGHYQNHMAIEWHPAWSVNSAAFKELTSGLVVPSLQRDQIWFIDYGLKPKHDNFAITDLYSRRQWEDSEEEVLVFDDAHGGRYVEVYFYENYINPHSGERVGSVGFDGTELFVSTDGSLARLMELFWEDLPKKMKSMRVSSGGKDWVQWGILAYLPPGFDEGKQRLEASSTTKTQETLEEKRNRLGPQSLLIADLNWS
ncbi:hypothetical protein B0H65DRAFT_523909 [Neurospora tetraspora]|uniref:2EXR domain-containing protein n=1 Tax=Neurospora tetraspora TaxID=94610 RepID=A0AAE0MR76_9PEZI|nr:hypothetical protein B0H65DRAFT_523909 [Neurospora tetraspora]